MHPQRIQKYVKPYALARESLEIGVRPNDAALCRSNEVDTNDSQFWFIWRLEAT